MKMGIKKGLFLMALILPMGGFSAHAEKTIQPEFIARPAGDGAPFFYSIHIGGNKYNCQGGTCPITFKPANGVGNSVLLDPTNLGTHVRILNDLKNPKLDICRKDPNKISSDKAKIKVPCGGMQLTKEVIAGLTHKQVPVSVNLNTCTCQFGG